MRDHVIVYKIDSENHKLFIMSLEGRKLYDFHLSLMSSCGDRQHFNRCLGVRCVSLLQLPPQLDEERARSEQIDNTTVGKFSTETVDVCRNLPTKPHDSLAMQISS